MPEHERSFTVMVGADKAFDFLADPMRIPDYVSTMTLEDSIAVEGELDVDADLKERDGAPGAGFVADRKTRRIEWGKPDADYGGSIEVQKGTTNSSGVKIRLRTRDDADGEAVTKVLDQTVSNIRRMLLAR